MPNDNKNLESISIMYLSNITEFGKPPKSCSRGLVWRKYQGHRSGSYHEDWLNS